MYVQTLFATLYCLKVCTLSVEFIQSFRAFLSPAVYLELASGHMHASQLISSVIELVSFYVVGMSVKLRIDTAQEMKFPIKNFFSKCDQMFSAELFTFTEEILNGKCRFCAV